MTVDEVDAKQAAALAMFDAKLASLAERETQIVGRQNMWLAHHWPAEYHERCVKLGRRHVCRRCAALYPVGILVAFVSAWGLAPWPDGWDPAAIWLLSIPATIAYCGEAVGLFRYNPKVQVATMLIAALGFGRALGYELVSRWSTEFWGPIAVFGGIWFCATMIGLTRKRARSGTRSLPVQ
ncbi:MAG: hypothetical protein ACI8TP_004453 [Acidimicrobiales bacterium]|jgi:hypothetical protein